MPCDSVMSYAAASETKKSQAPYNFRASTLLTRSRRQHQPEQPAPVASTTTISPSDNAPSRTITVKWEADSEAALVAPQPKRARTTTDALTFPNRVALATGAPRVHLNTPTAIEEVSSGELHCLSYVPAVGEGKLKYLVMLPCCGVFISPNYFVKWFGKKDVEGKLNQYCPRCNERLVVLPRFHHSRIRLTVRLPPPSPAPKRVRLTVRPLPPTLKSEIDTETGPYWSRQRHQMWAATAEGVPEEQRVPEAPTPRTYAVNPLDSCLMGDFLEKIEPVLKEAMIRQWDFEGVLERHSAAFSRGPS